MPRWAWRLVPGAIFVAAFAIGPFLKWFLNDHYGFDTWFFLLGTALYLIGYAIVYGFLLTCVRSARHVIAERKQNRPPPWEVCTRCGYSLIASRDRCPECGQAIPPWPIEQPRIRIMRGFVIVRRPRR